MRSRAVTRVSRVLLALALAAFLRGPAGSADRGGSLPGTGGPHHTLLPVSDDLSAMPREPRVDGLPGADRLPAYGSAPPARPASASSLAVLGLVLVLLGGIGSSVAASRRPAAPRAPPFAFAS